MEDNRDYQIIECKSCRESKKRIRAGKREASKETRFVGEDGLEWNGRLCGLCNRDRVKNAKRINKALRNQLKNV